MPDAVFTGPLSREAVAEAFASSDLFIFPSQTDTAGNVVLESQASGVPVVISGVGGPRENIVAGVTGTVCHRNDPDEWANAIAAVLREPGRRKKMAEAAREYGLSRTWPIAMRPLYRAYQDACMRAATATPPDAVRAAAHGV
jgi:glycosyltransferase involved in cell wall biosynthesis